MATFALLHGAYHAGWHFHLLARELEARRHRVIAPDLPCEEATAGAERYADVTAAALQPVTDEIVVVGHSPARLFPPLLPERNARIARLVFLGALLPEPGLSLDDQVRCDSSTFSHYLAKTEGNGHPDGSASCPEARALEVFFEDCPPDLAREAADRLRRQPARERSWQGNDAHAITAGVGQSLALIFATSPAW